MIFYFFFFCLDFSLCVCMVYLHVRMCPMHMPGTWNKSEEGIRFLGTEVRGGWEVLCGCWELYPGPLQQQQGSESLSHCSSSPGDFSGYKVSLCHYVAQAGLQLGIPSRMVSNLQSACFILMSGITNVHHRAWLLQTTRHMDSTDVLTLIFADPSIQGQYFPINTLLLSTCV